MSAPRIISRQEAGPQETILRIGACRVAGKDLVSTGRRGVSSCPSRTVWFGCAGFAGQVTDEKLVKWCRLTKKSNFSLVYHGSWYACVE